MAKQPSDKPAPKKGTASEFFVKGRGGKKQDASLHNYILDEGDDAAAREVTRRRREERLKAKK